MARVESGNVVKIRIGSHEFPIAIKVGRKIYRVCPVCGAVFSSANGWKKHIDAYHPEFFDYVSMLRISELMEIKSGLAQTGKSCIDRLNALIPNNAVIQYIEFRDGNYDVVGYVDKRKLLDYLNQFTCRDIRLRMVSYSKGIARSGRTKVNRYFKVPITKDRAIRFTISATLIDGMIAKKIIVTQTQSQENKPRPIPPEFNIPEPYTPKKPHQNQ